jgi:hypothetical protein
MNLTTEVAAINEAGFPDRSPDKRLWFVTRKNNWNQVCNGGLLAAALALADEEPELARTVIAGVRESLPVSVAAYDPGGAYPEGPAYWDYGTTYNVLALAMLDSALGTRFGLDKSPAFHRTTVCRLVVQSPNCNRWLNGVSLHRSPSRNPQVLFTRAPETLCQLIEAGGRWTDAARSKIPRSRRGPKAGLVVSLRPPPPSLINITPTGDRCRSLQARSYILHRHGSAAAQAMASMAFRRAAYSCFEIAPASNRILSSKRASVGEADGGNTGAGSGCAFAAAGNASPRSETMGPVFMSEVFSEATHRNRREKHFRLL